jgi:hypothetical protein
MSDNVIKLFSGKEPSTGSSEKDWSMFRPRDKRSRRNLRFLGKDLILESDDGDLIHDVSCNIDRAQVKLRLISKRLAGLKQQSAVEIEKLTAAEIKLRAAIVAVLEKKVAPRLKAGCRPTEGRAFCRRLHSLFPRKRRVGDKGREGRLAGAG